MESGVIMKITLHLNSGEVITKEGLTALLQASNLIGCELEVGTLDKAGSISTFVSNLVSRGQTFRPHLCKAIREEFPGTSLGLARYETEKVLLEKAKVTKSLRLYPQALNKLQSDFVREGNAVIPFTSFRDKIGLSRQDWWTCLLMLKDEVTLSFIGRELFVLGLRKK